MERKSHGRRTLQSTTTSQKSFQPSFSTLTADEQVKLLKPSEELLYYRKRINDFNNDHQEMLEIIERCKSFSDLNFQLEKELQRRNTEISQLQEAVSDLQIYLYQEREQVLKLYAENDKLQIRSVADRKKIHLLLSLSGTSEKELIFYLCDPKHSLIVPQLVPPRLRKYLDKHKAEKSAASDGTTKPSGAMMDQDILVLKVQSLSAQLQEQTGLFQDHIQSLHKDRDLKRKECAIQQKRLEEHVSSLTSRLKKSEEMLCDTMNDLLKLKEECCSKEITWIREKDCLLQNLENCRERLGELHLPGAGYTVSGSGTSETIPRRKSNALHEDLISVKEKLSLNENMVCMYQEQCAISEKEIAKLKNQAEASKNLFKERTQKLEAQVIYLKNKYNELDHRRKLQAEGFRNDIKFLGNRLRDVERCLHKVSLTVSPTHTTLSSEKGIVSGHETLAKSRFLEKEIKQIKSKVRDIEADLRL